MPSKDASKITNAIFPPFYLVHLIQHLILSLWSLIYTFIAQKGEFGTDLWGKFNYSFHETQLQEFGFLLC